MFKAQGTITAARLSRRVHTPAPAVPSWAKYLEESDGADLWTWICGEKNAEHECTLLYTTEAEMGINEPYSWGGSRGIYKETTATIAGIRVTPESGEDYYMTRAQIESISPEGCKLRAFEETIENELEG